jgi:hypothetical protein
MIVTADRVPVVLIAGLVVILSFKALSSVAIQGIEETTHLGRDA